MSTTAAGRTAARSGMRAAPPRTPPANGRWTARRVDLAERVGFEPTYTGEDVTGIPVQRLRPLGHLSGALTCKSGRAGYSPAARQANPMPADWIASITGP